MNPTPTPMPTVEDLKAMQQRHRDAQSIADCLSTLSKTEDPWAYVAKVSTIGDCTIGFNPVNSDLSILVIECGQERCVMHRMTHADPKIAQGDFGVMAQSRSLRAKGIKGIIEHWYTFMGAEELLRMATQRVPSDVMSAPDVFGGHFPMLYEAAAGGGV